ncbi:hypothetical protein KRIGEM_03245 [Komagataeibacter rhaeticus]|nr:hypothetical protein KRIGEM_03245 [Komagataeibacter rhaeticus]
MVLDLDHATAGSVRHTVIIAGHRHHPLAADPPLDAQNSIVAQGRQWMQMGLLLCKMLLHDPPGGGMCPRVGDIRAPDVELGVEVIEIMEAAAKEEVLNNCRPPPPSPRG